MGNPVIRVFTEHTNQTPIDSYVFIGPPQFKEFRPQADEVHISVPFTWNRTKALQLKLAWEQYYPIVKLGGCAYDDPCDGFTPGLYIKHGVTFTSRGCNNQCPWCLAWKREGKIRELPIYPGNIIEDNNLLQCSRKHIDAVFAMLKSQRGIQLSGGLESALITDQIAGQLRSLHLRQVFLAADTKEAIKPLRKALLKLGLPREKVRCYVLLKFNPNETISEATERMHFVWEAGAIPFALLYQPPTDKKVKYSGEWTRFQKTWDRPAAMKAEMAKVGMNG